MSNDSESEDAGHDAFQEDIVFAEHGSSDKQNQKRPRDGQYKEPEAHSEGDDAGILIFRGRGKRIGSDI